MADYSILKERATEVRTEVKAGANTAQRVGYLLEQIVAALEENDSATVIEEIKKLLPKMYSEDTASDTVLISTQEGAYIMLNGKVLEVCSGTSVADVRELIPRTITEAEVEARKEAGLWDVFLEANPLIYVIEG